MSPRRLSRRFYDRPSEQVAPDLLNKVLVVGATRGRIVEVEAYDPADPASHSFRGRTDRNQTMFGPPGHLYVYFTYGMHWCANAVCGPDHHASAVLLRAVEPVAGLDELRARRPRARRDLDLTNGPAKLCQAFALDRADDGADLVRPAGRVTIVDDGTPPPDRPGQSPRVGIRVATEVPWRWFVAGNPYVSGPHRHGPGGRRRSAPTRPGGEAPG